MNASRAIAFILGVVLASVLFAASKHEPRKTGNEHLQPRSIAAIVASTPDLKTLNVALSAAGMGKSLNDAGLQTLFAPTEAAFAKLPAGALDDLIKPENHDKLLAILTYHLALSRIEAKQLAKLKFVPTINGDPLAIAIDGKRVTVDGAHVIKADIPARNGVIYMIDTLLMPDGK